MSYSTDRIFIHEGRPPGAPNKCAVCTSEGNRDARKFVDLGTHVPRYGKLYLCEYCFNEVADALAFMGPANYEKTLLKVQTQSEEINRLKEENARLRAMVGDSIPKLQSDLAILFKIDAKSPQPVKRGPGRPKSTE